MANMKYGLIREIVMELAFKTVDKTGWKNLFQGGELDRHGSKSLGGAALNYLCAHNSLSPIVELCLQTGQSPMTSLDLCLILGWNIIHRPGKVVTEMGHRKVHALTSVEREKNRPCMHVSFGACTPPPPPSPPRDDLSMEEVCSRHNKEGGCSWHTSRG